MSHAFPVTIRRFEPADLATVRALIHRTIDAAYAGVYPPRAIRYFKDYHSLDALAERERVGGFLVVECGGCVIGTGAVVGDEITGVFIDPEHQGRGIGAVLMDRLEDMARIAGNDVATLYISLPSRGFYERRGYEVLESGSLDVGGGERLDYWTARKSLLAPRVADSR